jgi:hypothetical protein
VEKPIGKYEPSAQNLDRIRAKKLNADNRIVKKKFKAEHLFLDYMIDFFS